MLESSPSTRARETRDFTSKGNQGRGSGLKQKQKKGRHRKMHWFFFKEGAMKR